MRDDGHAVRGITTAVYVIPTDAPEADGTLAWDATTMVLARASAGTEQGIGWSYAAAAAQSVITDVLAGVVVGRSALDVPGAAEAMTRAVRNIGRPGIAATAISAVDVALWDLKIPAARLPADRSCSVRPTTACRSAGAAVSPVMTTARPAEQLVEAGSRRTTHLRA